MKCRAVLLHAAARSAALIVIGVEHGRAQHRTFGAVAEDVLRSAPRPTADRSRAPTPYVRIRTPPA
jgi:hypothetical protein